MSEAFVIKVSRAIDSAAVLAGSGQQLRDGERQQRPGSGGDDAGRESLMQTAAALKAATAKLNEFFERMVTAHREAIARLSVEIARKILVQKVSDKDYEITSIVTEALKNAPSHQDIVVHLNPEDLGRFQDLKETETVFAGVKFAADGKVGCAECVVETPKGIVESVIEGHLEQVSRVLTKAV